MKDCIYHITSRFAWAEARASGVYRADTLASQGFIHCSSREQVIAVADAFYRAQENLVLLEIDPECLRSDIRWEAGTDKPQELFPHIHGPLNLDAVVRVFDFYPNADGSFKLPMP